MSDAVLNVHMPKKLRDRIRVMEKTLRLSATAITITALTKEVELFEQKERDEKERQRREREEQKERRRAVLADVKLDNGAPISPPPTIDNQLSSLFEHHAQRIVEALEAEHPDPREVRLRRDEALAAIRRQFPLTHPSEQEMLATLERLIRSFQKKQRTRAPPSDDDDEVITIKESP